MARTAVASRKCAAGVFTELALRRFGVKYPTDYGVTVKRKIRAEHLQEAAAVGRVTGCSAGRGLRPCCIMQKSVTALNICVKLRICVRITTSSTYNTASPLRYYPFGRLREFFQDRALWYCSTPIITGNDGVRGTGEMFKATTRDDADYEQDFFWEAFD